MERTALLSSVISIVFLIGSCTEVDVTAPGTKQFYYLLGKKEFITDQIFLISLYSKSVNSSTSINQSQGSLAFSQLIKSQVAAINKAVEQLNGTDGERCTRCLQSQIEDITQAVGRDIVNCLQPLVTATVQLEKSLIPIEKELKENYVTLNVSSCNKEEDEESKYECILSYLIEMFSFITNKTILVNEKKKLVEVLLLTDVAKCFSNSASTGLKAVNVAVAGLNACSEAAGVPLKLPVFSSFVGNLLTLIEDARRRFNRKGLGAITDKFIQEEENLKIFLSQAQSIINDKAEDIVLSTFNKTIVAVDKITVIVNNTQYAWCNRNSQSQLKSIIVRVKEDLIRCAEDLINKGKNLQSKLAVLKAIIKDHLTNYGFSSIVLCFLDDTELFVRSDINTCTRKILNEILNVKEATLKDIAALGKEITALESYEENCQKLVLQARKRADNVLTSLKQCARL